MKQLQTKTVITSQCLQNFFTNTFFTQIFLCDKISCDINIKYVFAKYEKSKQIIYMH